MFTTHLAPIKRCKGYLISKDGLVFRGDKQCRQTLLNTGYYAVRLRKYGWSKAFTVHRLMAEAFLPAPKDGEFLVRHLNDIKTDNRIENLAWGNLFDNASDRKRNLKYQGKRGSGNWAAKLNDDDIMDIRIVHSFGASQRDIGKAFGVRQQAISKICRFQRWSHIK